MVFKLVTDLHYDVTQRVELKELQRCGRTLFGGATGTAGYHIYVNRVGTRSGETGLHNCSRWYELSRGESAMASSPPARGNRPAAAHACRN